MNITFTINGIKYKAIRQFSSVINPCQGCAFFNSNNDECTKATKACIDNNIIYVRDESKWKNSLIKCFD